MNKETIRKYHDKLLKLVITDFEKSLLEACLNNLLDKKNKLRFNNFAYSIRELSRHFLISLAPDKEVENCRWYKNETKKPGKISRGERIKYAIQGGIKDEYILKELFDIDDFKRPVVKSIELLNKYTHINTDTFDLSDDNVKKLSSKVVSSFSNFVYAISSCKKHLITELETHIDNAFIEHSIYEVIDEIDILSTHHNIEEIYTSSIKITELNSRHIGIEAYGILAVRQQWGSDGDQKRGDGLVLNNSFPFESVLKIDIDKKFPKSKLHIEKFNIDTDDW